MNIRITLLVTLFLAMAPQVAAAANTIANPAGIQFTDVAPEAGLDFVQTIGDEKMSNIMESAGVGCAFLDYDQDGWLDIYLVNGCWREGYSDPEIDPALVEANSRATDQLFRNRGDGTFEDVTVQAGIQRSAFGMGVITGDYDGDGDPDIYVTNHGPNFLYRNNGDGTFDDVAPELGVDIPDFNAGAVFLDYDRDGILDLYVGGYIVYDAEYDYYYAPDGFPGPLAYLGLQDRLFKGMPGGRFTEVTQEAGLAIDPLGRAMGIGTFDYDNNGFPDVFISNDAMENYLLRNKGDGTFENLAWEARVAFGEAGDATAAMAVEVADFDGDGLFDVFVPDLDFSCLYRNTGQGDFDDESARSGVAASCGQYDSWGSVLADFDLDGHIDLYVSNGDVHHLEAQEDLVFRGDGTGRFEDVSEESGEWAFKKFVSRGVASGDYDNDGDVDLLVVNLNDRPTLLRNDTPREGKHWLSVTLVGAPANPDAIGAVVKVQAGDRTMARQRVSGGSYLSQHDHRLHFGLGEHKQVDRLEVVWPDGSTQVITNCDVDQVLTIHQEPGQ